LIQIKSYKPIQVVRVPSHNWRDMRGENCERETTVDLLTKKGALAQSKLVDAPQATLADGEVRMHVDLFSLTANNVTYGAAGDFLQYWRFYPTGEEGWGRVPVWGFATAVESKSASIAVGERVYGYLPMSETFVVKPGERKHGGFAETNPQRAGLAPVYNNYVFNAGDPLYAKDTEALQVLFRPLFTTSFLIDDFLADAGYFGGKQIIFSSASAKTSYAAAQLLKARGDVKVVGLTSASNVGFTKALGFYDDVLAYKDIGGMAASVPTVFVDIAGNSGVRASVHAQFGDALSYSCAVGATHWDAPRQEQPPAGPAPKMFFAPDVVKKRITDWGPAGFSQKVGAAWAAFLPTAARTTKVVESCGLEAAAKVFADLASGRGDPSEGRVIRL
jgi:NADPH:quinone reductase-like Zn-dependent oxidoreductase